MFSLSIDDETSLGCDFWLGPGLKSIKILLLTDGSRWFKNQSVLASKRNNRGTFLLLSTLCAMMRLSLRYLKNIDEVRFTRVGRT